MDGTDGGEGPATPVADRHLGQRIAVIGSGVSGLTAAYLLRDVHRVTVFESEARLGGHAHTHDVVSGQETFGVDSGFIVHNDRTYPYLRRLFAELEVDVHPTEMSMSIGASAPAWSTRAGAASRASSRSGAGRPTPASWVCCCRSRDSSDWRPGCWPRPTTPQTR